MRTRDCRAALGGAGQPVAAARRPRPAGTAARSRVTEPGATTLAHGPYPRDLVERSPWYVPPQLGGAAQLRHPREVGYDMNAQVWSLRPLSRIVLTAGLALAPTFSLGAAAAHAQTADTASVRIIKDAQPNGPHNFHFTTDLRQTNEEGLDNFTLDDD